MVLNPGEPVYERHDISRDLFNGFEQRFGLDSAVDRENRHPGVCFFIGEKGSEFDVVVDQVDVGKPDVLAPKLRQTETIENSYGPLLGVTLEPIDFGGNL